MRTTVTLERDVAERLKALAHRRRTSFKTVINDVLRRGLNRAAAEDAPPPFRVEPHCGGFRPGVDPARLNQLVDDLEVDDFVGR